MPKFQGILSLERVIVSEAAFLFSAAKQIASGPSNNVWDAVTFTIAPKSARRTIGNMAATKATVEASKHGVTVRTWFLLCGYHYP